MTTNSAPAKIHVCSLALIQEVVAQQKPSHVVSLLGPGTQFPVVDHITPVRHHKVELDDIRQHMDGYVTPGERHIIDLIDFLKSWDLSKDLAVHCWAGISRSSATAFIAACMHNPETQEEIIAKAIADASPTAYPNTLIVEIADKILNRGGRMLRAAEKICADPQRMINIRTIDKARPFSIAGKF